MYFKHLFLSLTVVILTLVFSCEDEEPEKFPLSEDVKSLFDFKEGSYWIYRNSKTGMEDCTYVRNYGQRYQTIKKNDSHNGEKVEYEMIGYDLNWIRENVNMFFHVENNGRKSIETQINYRVGNDAYAYPSGNFFNAAQEARKKLDTLTVGNILYTDVLIDNRNLVLDNELLQKYYLKKNIGFVKLEFKDSTVYELVRYNVIQ